jgi:catechol 2,3-dioxygenase-like lactoylglutathione lyase family enzyme
VRLNHLHLHVRDLARARRFYEDHFGFRYHVTHGAIVFLRDEGDLDLALAPADAVEPLPPWFHFGFRLPSAAAVEALHARMATNGETITAPFSADPDYAWFRCRDPDGYAIEVYWE